VRLDYVERLERSAIGKLRLVVSQVDNPEGVGPSDVEPASPDT
jgi:hypothetical protein